MSKNSEIFDNYAKIALENGLIKASEEKSKKINETNPRFDSVSVKDIANLYNVKNDRPADMEYKKNIIEDAHPEPVVFFNSHDKINSLVENQNERQNIIINILQKMPNGNLTQKKYANDLALSLIRVATDMDNQNKEELRVLADTCAEQLQKTANPLVIGAVASIAVAGGLIYLKNHTDYNNEGVQKNGFNLISQLEDIITSGTGLFSMKSEYRDELKEQLRNVQNEVQKMLQAYSKIALVVDQIEAPHTQNDLDHIIQTAKLVSSKPAMSALYNNFKSLAKNIEPMLKQLTNNFKSESYKNKEVKNEGLGGKINDFFGGVFYGGKGLVADEFDDVVHAITPFRNSIKEVLEQIAGAESAEKDAVRKSEEANQTASFYDNSSHQTSGLTESHSGTLDDLEKEIAALTHSFNAG